MGGGLVQLLGAATALLADAVSFLASAVFLHRIHTVEPKLARPPRPDLRAEIAEGLRYVLRHPLLRPITACTGTSNLFSGVVASMTVSFVLGSLAVGYSVVVYNVAQVSFRQAICPDRLLGRMNASIRFLVWGTLPLGGWVARGAARRVDRRPGRPHGRPGRLHPGRRLGAPLSAATDAGPADRSGHDNPP
ncbi:MAG: hypothetical protein ACRDT0_13990 [Pseudonocardiaceae bacterium]